MSENLTPKEMANKLRAMHRAIDALKEIGLVYHNGDEWMFDYPQLKEWKKNSEKIPSIRKIIEDAPLYDDTTIFVNYFEAKEVLDS